MKNTKIKTFFFMIRNQEKREKELNDFISRDNIVIDQILQSASTGSVYEESPKYLDIGAVITIVYHEI